MSRLYGSIIPQSSGPSVDVIGKVSADPAGNIQIRTGVTHPDIRECADSQVSVRQGVGWERRQHIALSPTEARELCAEITGLIEPPLVGADLDSILEAARDAFWCVVADAYPLSERGDLTATTNAEFNEVTKGAVEEWVEINVPNRDEMFERLCKAYGCDPSTVWTGSVSSAFSDDDECGRYAAVAAEWNTKDHAVQRFETVNGALAALGDAMIDGYAPEAVYDLDTAERIEVRVPTPTLEVTDEAAGPNRLKGD